MVLSLRSSLFGAPIGERTRISASDPTKPSILVPLFVRLPMFLKLIIMTSDNARLSDIMENDRVRGVFCADFLDKAPRWFRLQS